MVFPFRFKEEILLEQGEVKLLTDALFYQKPPETGHPVISYFFQNFLSFFSHIILFMVWSCRWCAQVFQYLVKNCSNDCIDQKLLQIHGFVLYFGWQVVSRPGESHSETSSNRIWYIKVRMLRKWYFCGMRSVGENCQGAVIFNENVSWMLNLTLKAIVFFSSGRGILSMANSGPNTNKSQL